MKLSHLMAKPIQGFAFGRKAVAITDLQED